MANKKPKQLEEKEKLNFLEKISIKRMLKKTTKDLENWKQQITQEKEKRKEEKRKKENDEFENKLRERITKGINEMGNIFTLEEDDGTPITQADLQNKTTEELIQTFEEIIKSTQELLR